MKEEDEEEVMVGERRITCGDPSSLIRCSLYVFMFPVISSPASNHR